MNHAKSSGDGLVPNFGYRPVSRFATRNNFSINLCYLMLNWGTTVFGVPEVIMKQRTSMNEQRTAFNTPYKHYRERPLTFNERDLVPSIAINKRLKSQEEQNFLVAGLRLYQTELKWIVLLFKPAMIWYSPSMGWGPWAASRHHRRHSLPPTSWHPSADTAGAWPTRQKQKNESASRTIVLRKRFIVL